MKITSSFVLNGQRKKWWSNSRWKRVIITVAQSVQFYHMCGVIRIPADSIHHVTSLMSCTRRQIQKWAIHEGVKPAGLYLFIYLFQTPASNFTSVLTWRWGHCCPSRSTDPTELLNNWHFLYTDWNEVGVEAAKVSQITNSFVFFLFKRLCLTRSPPGIWCVHFYPKLTHQQIYLIVDGLPVLLWVVVFIQRQH